MERSDIVRSIVALVIVLVLGLGGWYRATHINHPAWRGLTMGTSYSVQISGSVKRHQLTELQQAIESRLEALNQQLSTWEEESEISRFNRSPEKSLEISPAFAAVMARSLDLAEQSNGAFDPTLNPLLNLWGFGSESKETKRPDAESIKAVRASIGWGKLKLDGTKMVKTMPKLELDLGAIAKGYGVDQIAQLLQQAGFSDWFVEIGGEVVVKGHNPDGVPWRIGIQYPTTNLMDERLQGIANITQGAIATSGDYRNYVIEEGKVYSHILDPRSGEAVRSETASTTVLAPNCMDADGIATALFVMGPEEGLAWVEQLPDIEALFLVRGNDGEIFEIFSSGFREAAGYSPQR